ncbi:hypothetical protein [Klebsiella pneumoniae]|uniref:hypothetical protein n=1 Tax=Klebsiella pneumoniae TaxID=573 RepID=UPI001E5611ED
MASYNDRLVRPGVWRVSPEYPFAAVVPLVRLSVLITGFSFRCTTASPRLLAKAGIRAQQTPPAWRHVLFAWQIPFMN